MEPSQHLSWRINRLLLLIVGFFAFRIFIGDLRLKGEFCENTVSGADD
jgi:hypothetical protein